MKLTFKWDWDMGEASPIKKDVTAIMQEHPLTLVDFLNDVIGEAEKLREHAMQGFKDWCEETAQSAE